jgi:uncharacterized protein (TIGR02266 family)
MDVMRFGIWALILFLGFVSLWIAYYFFKTRAGSAPESPVPLKLAGDFGAEKRKHPRTDVNWPASMETSMGIVSAEVKNISVGGAFIGCRKPLPMGEVFHMTMTGPDKEPVTATAEVVWSNANLQEDKVVNRGMGVRFLKMSDKHIQIVRRLFPEGD